MTENSITKATIYLTISSLLFVVSAYIANIFLARYLGPVTYGKYGVIISLLTLLNLIQTSGLPQALSKYIAQDESKSDEILKSGLILQLISTLLISSLYLILAHPLANLLHDSSLVSYFQLSTLIFPLYGIFALYIGYYNGLHLFKKQAFLSVVYYLVKAFLVILLAVFLQLKGVIVGFIAAPLIALIFGFYYPKSVAQKFSYKKLILFSLPLIGFAFLSSLQLSIDLFFVKALISYDNASGYYTANQNISQIVFFGLNAFSVILYPSISRSVSNSDYHVTKKLIRNSLRYILILLVPGVLLISATARPLTQLIYSSKYIQGSDSLSILVIGVGFLTLFTVLANILNGAGHGIKSLIISGIGVGTTTLLCLLLIPKFGLSGAALSTTLGGFIAMILAIFLVYQRFNQLLPFNSLIKILLASLSIYVVARFIQTSSLFLPVLYILLLAIYFALLYLMKEITKQEIQQVRNLLPAWVLLIFK